MRVGIDVSLLAGNKAGVGCYTAGLLEGLAAIDQRNDYYLYPFFYHIFHPQLKDVTVPEQRNFHLRFRSLPYSAIEYLWFRSGYARKRLLGKVDVLHSTTFCVPDDHYGKLVLTIHDNSVLLFPDYHTEANRLHCLEGILKAACRADRLIAVSESCKRDLVEYLAVPPEKIVVTPEAARKGFARVTDRKLLGALQKKYKMDASYILNVGTLEPRKNVRRLIEAYALLPPNLRREVQLVIAGGEGWLSSDLGMVVRRLGLSDRVRFLGYVRDEELVTLYSFAELFVYPSLYEGFGLPVVEAMACGAPVISSNRSSIPEVAGKATVLVNPEDVLELACAMEVLLEKPEYRRKLSKLGLERAQEFSWKKTAEQTLAVYQELAEC